MKSHGAQGLWILSRKAGIGEWEEKGCLAKLVEEGLLNWL